MKLIFIAMFTFMFMLESLSANNIIGSIKKVNGNVKVKHEGSIKKSKVKLDYEISSGDLIVSARDASTVIALADGSILALSESSSIHFKSLTNAEQFEGKIYYKITSRDAKSSLKIKTPFAIIGIKGTNFVVDASQNKAIILKEGLIGIRSLKEEFNLYRKKVLSEYEEYKRSQMSEYEKYKRAPGAYELPVQTKEFDLEAGNSVTFNENRVNEDALTQENDSDFEYFETLINAE